jgi:hypothetical protein
MTESTRLDEVRSFREQMNQRILAHENFDIRRFFALDSRVYRPPKGRLPDALTGPPFPSSPDQPRLPALLTAPRFRACRPPCPAVALTPTLSTALAWRQFLCPSPLPLASP